MNEKQMLIIGIMAVVFIALFIIVNILDSRSLNGIKAKKTGDGQHGTARWATAHEIRQSFVSSPFAPGDWRQGNNLPSVQGTVVGCSGGKHTTALVDTGDVHTLMIGAAGVGKTAYFLYPNIEFACASGMSFLSTDTKGDIARNYGAIARDCYGYNVSVIDLRYPTRSDENNILHLVNKYMDIYLSDPTNLSAKAKAEKYAKITAKTIINIGSADSSAYGQNAFFYDAAEGLLASVILLLAEFGEENERHIVSIFKLIQELIAKPLPKSDLQAENTKLNQEIDLMRLSLEEKVELINKLNKERMLLKDERSRLNKVISGLTNKVQSLTDELSSLKNRFNKVMDFIHKQGLKDKLESFLHPKRKI